MPLSCSITLSDDASFVLTKACNITYGRIFQVITCLSPSKNVGRVVFFWILHWAELSWVEFWTLGRVVLGRVLCGPSWFWADLSCTRFENIELVSPYEKKWVWSGNTTIEACINNIALYIELYAWFRQCDCFLSTKKPWDGCRPCSPPEGGFWPLWFPYTTIYMPQNETC